MRLFLLLVRSSFHRFLARHLVASFGIVLGVASILVLGLLNQNARRTTVQNTENVFGQSMLTISRIGPAESLFPQGILGRVENLPGIQAAVPSLMIRTGIADGTFPVDGGIDFFGLRTAGDLYIKAVIPSQEMTLHTYQLSEGRFIQDQASDPEIVLESRYAASKGLKIGRSVNINTLGGVRQFHLVGLLDLEGPGLVDGDALGIIQLRTGQELFLQPDTISRIDIALDDLDSVAVDVLRQSIQNRLGQGYILDDAAYEDRYVTNLLNVLRLLLAVFGVGFILLGVVWLANSYAVSMTERTEEVSRLRALGMTIEQTRWYLLGEVGILGLVNAGFGVGLGLVLVRSLSRFVSDLVKYQYSPFMGSFWLFLLCGLVGLGCTILAVIGPVRKLSALNPMQSLGLGGPPSVFWFPRYTVWIGIVLLVFGSVLMYFDVPVVPNSLIAIVTSVLFFAGVILSLPPAAWLWGWFARPFMMLFFGSSGRLGSSSLLSDRLWTGLSTAALVLTIAGAIFVHSLGFSYKTHLAQWTSGSLGGDLYVRASNGVSLDLTRRLETLTGVQSAVPIGYFPVSWVRSDGTMEQLVFTAIDPTDCNQMFALVDNTSQIDCQSAFDPFSQRPGVFISSLLSQRYGLHQGDVFQLATAFDVQDFEISGITVNHFNQGMILVGSLAQMRHLFKQDIVSEIQLNLENAANLTSDHLRVGFSLLGNRFNLGFVSGQDIRDRLHRQVGRIFTLFDVLGIAVVFAASVAAAVSWVNKVKRRTRDFSFLRSVGMTRRQMSLMVFAETSTTGLFAAVIGIGLGILQAYILLPVLETITGSDLVFTIPIEGLLAVAIVVMLVTFLAAVISWRYLPRHRLTRFLS